MDNSCQIYVLISEAKIVSSDLLDRIADDDCGAQMLFLGCTRRHTDAQITELLCYEAYVPMAESEMRFLACQAADRWPLRHVAIQHRLGPVPVGEPSVAIAASAAHRPAVMEAIPWMMDRLKNHVPIWKREHFADGSNNWVHPIS